MNLDDLKNAIGSLNLKSKVETLAAKASPRATSSRMIVTVVAIVSLLWLFKGNLAPIISGIIGLVGLFLICRTITDVATIVMDGLIKRTLADNLTKDGELSDADKTDLS